MRLLPRLSLVNIASSIVIGAASLPLYWAIIDRQPVASSVSEIIANEVAQGGYLEIHYDLTWNSSCTITAYRYVIDSLRVQWPIAPRARKVREGPDEFTIRVPIPLAASPGVATYQATLEYECNPLQRLWPLEQQLKPRGFVIVAGQDAAGGLQPMSWAGD